MAKCQKDASGSNINIGSLLMAHHHHRTPSGNLRLWTSSFGRIISDALSCGGSSYRFRHSPDDDEIPLPESAAQLAEPHVAKNKNGKSEKLSDLLSMAEAESELEIKRKVDALEKMEAAVRDLQDSDRKGNWEKRGDSARRVRSLAKEDPEARSTLAMLGAIPPLVGMLDLAQSEKDEGNESDCMMCLAESLYGLLNIGIGNDANKAAIVKAGAVHKMLKITDYLSSPSLSISEAIVANFLGLSALDSNKPIIGSSGAIPFLVDFLKNLGRGKSNIQARVDALKALYNLSIYPPNISFLLEGDLIPFLINTLGDMDVSERVLLILSNIVPTPEGRKAISSVHDAFPILVDVLNWNDSPVCQEVVSYILLVMSHKAYGDRQAMVDAGVVTALLELTLLGSTLAQKRASRILECLRVDKGKRVSDNCGNLSMAVSAPIYGSASTSIAQLSKECLEDSEDMMSEEKKAVKQLVQQSLQSNMKRIVNRANLPHDFAPSDHFKSLSVSSTSKSVPF